MPEQQNLRRTEAKAYFANERTFLHWMSTSVTIGSISAAMSGVAGHAHRHWGDDYITQAIYVRVISLLMLTLAITIALYAGFNFIRRANMLQMKMDGPYDSKVLPVLLSVAMIAALVVVFTGAVVRLQDDGSSDSPPVPPAASAAPMQAAEMAKSVLSS